MNITILGAGMAEQNQLSLTALSLLEQADLCIGAKRLTDAFAPPHAQVFPLIDPHAIQKAIAESTKENIVILMSGDTGFHSGTTKLLPLLSDYNVQIIPGISSIQTFSAAIKKPWQSWKLCSAHGLDCNIVSTIRRNQESFFLTGGHWTVSAICSHLTQWGLGHLTVWIGESLGTPNQRVLSCLAEDPVVQQITGLAVCLVLNPSACRQSSASIPDEEFLRGEIPMTKREIRSVVVSKLQLCPDDIVYDVGAGTGSVSVEIAHSVYEGKIYAIEREAEGCRLIRENAKKHYADNLRCIHGVAPLALEELPPPQAVFIGGSSGNLEEILLSILHKNPKVRMVVTAVTLETITEMTTLCGRLPLENPEIVQLTVSRSKKLGNHHLMMGQNPIYIFHTQGIRPSDPL